MKLELGYIDIKDIQFASESKVENGVIFLDGLSGGSDHFFTAIGLRGTGDLQIGIALGGSGASGQQQCYQQQRDNFFHCFSSVI